MHAAGEEREELTSVYEAPEADTEAAQAEQKQEDVVTIEAELEASEGEAAARARPLVRDL